MPRSTRLTLIAAVLSMLASGTGRADEEKAVTLSGKPGPYTVAMWKHDWPGCAFESGIKEGRVELVQEDATRWLRVKYPKGSHGQEPGGAGWRFPLGKHESAEVRYVVRFDQEFDFVKGGKLPGLSGGPDSVTGGRPATGTNGFSARLMWRKDGHGEAYVYHVNQPGRYGHSFPFPEDFRFPREVPVHVRMAVKINTVGQRDGTLKVWIAIGEEKEKLMVSKQDMEWRTVDDFSVDSILFNTFHGGDGAEWAPKRDVFANFSGFRFTTH